MNIAWFIALVAVLLVAGMTILFWRQHRALAVLQHRLEALPAPEAPAVDPRDLDQKAFNLFALYQANKILNLSHDPEVQCKIIVDMFMEVISASACYLLLFDEAAEALSLKTLKGREAPPMTVRLTGETRDELLRIKEPFGIDQWAVGPLSRGVGDRHDFTLAQELCR